MFDFATCLTLTKLHETPLYVEKKIFQGVRKNFGQKIFKNREVFGFANEVFSFAFGLTSTKLHETPSFAVKRYFKVFGKILVKKSFKIRRFLASQRRFLTSHWV